MGNPAGISFGGPSPGEWSGYRWGKITTGGGRSWNNQVPFDINHPGESSMGFGPDDIRFQETCKKKDAELARNMTERQKRMLSALESGKFFKLSRLVEEPRS
jgi:hypothetical protein